SLVRVAPSWLLLSVWLPLARPAAPPSFEPRGDPLPSGATLRLGSSRLRHPARIESLALSPDGKTLASADYAGRVRLWDTGNGRLRLDLPPGTGSAVVFAPNGQVVATANNLGRRNTPVSLWDVASGKRVRTFLALSGSCVAFAPDG